MPSLGKMTKKEKTKGLLPCPVTFGEWGASPSGDEKHVFANERDLTKKYAFRHVRWFNNNM